MRHATGVLDPTKRNIEQKPQESDKRLERLYDYTKFHIGIYLSAAAGLTGLISAIAGGKLPETFTNLVGSPAFLGLSLFFMVLAGACGGVVATSVTECKSFEDFWGTPTGPSWRRQGPLGKSWVAAEHLFFWLSLACALVSVLSHGKTWSWVTSLAAP